MDDLGAPTSYLALTTGIAVLSSDGQEIGSVRHVLAAVEEDVFDGLVLDTPDGPRFADAELVGDLYERGAVLTIDAAAAERLPEPSENPAELATGPDDTVDDGADLGGKLRRAWDLISGKY
jgi:hypothetical protein